jgi:hypothetical protein
VVWIKKQKTSSRLPANGKAKTFLGLFGPAAGEKTFVGSFSTFMKTPKLLFCPRRNFPGGRTKSPLRFSGRGLSDYFPVLRGENKGFILR